MYLENVLNNKKNLKIFLYKMYLKINFKIVLTNQSKMYLENVLMHQ